MCTVGQRQPMYQLAVPFLERVCSDLHRVLNGTAIPMALLYCSGSAGAAWPRAGERCVPEVVDADFR